MRLLFCSIASLLLVLLAFGCNTVSPDECWVNTSGGLGGSEPIPIWGLGAALLRRSKIDRIRIVEGISRVSAPSSVESRGASLLARKEPPDERRTGRTA